MSEDITHRAFFDNKQTKEITVIVWPEKPIGFGNNTPKIETVKITK